MPVDDSDTKSLLHMDGADASTTFTDESGKTWTPGGTAQIDDALYKFGQSGLFDGNSDSIDTPSHADFEMGTGAFTIDFWVYMVNQTGAQCFWGKTVGDVFLDPTDGVKKSVYAYYSGTLKFGGGNNNEWNTGKTFGTGAWHHLMFGWNGLDTQYAAVDGVMTSTAAASFRSAEGGKFQIGFNFNISWLNGNVDEFRVSRVLRWASNFTPPTFPYGVTGDFGATRGRFRHCGNVDPRIP